MRRCREISQSSEQDTRWAGKQTTSYHGVVSGVELLLLYSKRLKNEYKSIIDAVYQCD